VRYLLDTHTWIWWHTQPRKLSGKVKKLIEDSSHYDEMLISAISPWEFCKLLEKQRIGISCDPVQWINSALNMSLLRWVPLTPVIAYKSTVLPPPFHQDPADQIIVATAREEHATILTSDKRILSYPHVKAIW
jgi:PIN domain nuclease of toxin-antitoxin system